MRFLVDTGATTVTLPAAEARRLGIDYQHGQRGRMQTANGQRGGLSRRCSTA